ncbi:molybdopterin synthase catalytic subunit [Sporobolomyces koalae]|uniref:molybdopterin synthase catalytic subunit n=1 Tax=Sporobolomyces koalae TaxID=500713 RepID=UPI003178E71E
MSTSTIAANPAVITTSYGDTACLSYEPLDPAAIEASVRSSQSGAVVSFVGYTRDNFQGRQVTHLVYESYVPLALKTMSQILEEARTLPRPPPLADAHQCCAASASGPETVHDRQIAAHSGAVATIDVNRIHVAHLLGPSPPLTPSIVITVASPHRREAFWLTEWLLERVKERVQVWKREHYADEEQPFVGRDGYGPNGLEGAEQSGSSRWKENFQPNNVVRIDL